MTHEHEFDGASSLGGCQRCGGRAGYLTTDCPCVPYEYRVVLDGRLDYVNGRWVDKGLTDADGILVRAQVAVCAEYPDHKYPAALAHSSADLRRRFSDVVSSFARGYYAGIERADPTSIPQRIADGDNLLQAGKVFAIQHMLEEAQGWKP